jgi:hypothetical protein
MLLEELIRNKKAIVGFIIVVLCIIYIISKKFLFRTILGRLLLVIGLIAITNCNKMLGLGSVIVICLAYSQMSNDFENMENPSSKTSPNPSSKTSPNPSSKTIPKPSSKTSPKPSSNNNSTTSIPNKTTPDIATIEEKKRNMITGKKASSLPIPPKDSAKDVSGTSNVKESFLNFAPY